MLGSSIYHVGLQVGSYWSNQELPYLTSAMYEARDLAMRRLEEEASLLGADGIVGVALEAGSYSWAGNALEFTAVGTAVKGPAQGSWRRVGGEPFTSDFSVQDFHKLLSCTNCVPRELVVGNCVYHVAHQNFGSAIKTLGRNVELPNYTSAIYDARELAMSRMQQEAEAHDADGIVGMKVMQTSHAWASHVMEFLAIGTSVQRIGRAPSESVPLMLQLGLND